MPLLLGQGQEAHAEPVISAASKMVVSIEMLRFNRKPQVESSLSVFCLTPGCFGISEGAAIWQV
jgi:hypothetical protein